MLMQRLGLQHKRKADAPLAVFGICVLFLACISQPVYAAAGATPVQLTIGSIPSDRILVMELKLTSITVKPVNGVPLSILPKPVVVEFAELGDVSEPLALVTLPPGKYSQIAISSAGGNITYVGGTTMSPAKREFSRSFISYVPLQPALVVNSAPVILNLKLDIGNTISVNLVGTPNLNKPVFRASVNSSSLFSAFSAQAASNERFTGIVGTVIRTSAASFSMIDAKTTATLTFSTNANTQFSNASLSTLNGMIVEVSGTINRDGSLLAGEVEAGEYQSGTVVQGLPTGLVPDSSRLPFVAQVGAGGNMTTASFGSSFALDASQSPTFVVDTNGIDMTGLDFLQFNWLSFVVGQHVQVETTSQVQPDPNGTSGRISAQTIKLEPQTISGQIVNYQQGNAPGSFTMDLVLPANHSSYLNVLNPRASTVHVYQQPGTVLQGISGGMRNGIQVRVRGLLFYSPIPGNGTVQMFALVAGEISQ
jgi:Domain of unknown function (DUF5666)